MTFPSRLPEAVIPISSGRNLARESRRAWTLLSMFRSGSPPSRSFAEPLRVICLLREQNKEEHSFWPDFLLVTKEDGEYVLNILEPHRKNEDDNYSKAESMVNYVEQAKNPNIGRVELIRIENDRILRLDFATSVVKEEMKHVHNNDDLKNLFSKLNK